MFPFAVFFQHTLNTQMFFQDSSILLCKSSAVPYCDIPDQNGILQIPVIRGKNMTLKSSKGDEN